MAKLKRTVVFNRGQRVVAKVGKNEWYVGTVAKVGIGITIDFDDGLEAEVSGRDLEDVHPIGHAGRQKKTLTDAQAKNLIAAYNVNDDVVAPYVPPKQGQIDHRLVFIPPPALMEYKKVFQLMTRWCDTVVARFKLSEKVVTIDKQHGSVGARRTFKTKTDVQAKYERMIASLKASFLVNPNWRAQGFVGAHTLFSVDGVFQATFYDIADPNIDGARQIGFYLMCRPS